MVSLKMEQKQYNYTYVLSLIQRQEVANLRIHDLFLVFTKREKIGNDARSRVAHSPNCMSSKVHPSHNLNFALGTGF